MPLIIYTTPEERSAVAMRDEFALLGLQALRSERALRSLRSQLDELAPSTPSNTSVVDLRLSLRTEPSGCTAEAMALVLLWMHTQGHCDRAMASSFKSGLSTYYERIAAYPNTNTKGPWHFNALANRWEGNPAQSLLVRRAIMARGVRERVQDEDEERQVLLLLFPDWQSI